MPNRLTAGCYIKHCIIVHLRRNKFYNASHYKMSSCGGENSRVDKIRKDKKKLKQIIALMKGGDVSADGNFS